VVPRFFGGANHHSNYVLACSECNQERGSQLFFCECYFCGPLIRAAIAHDGNVNAQFDAIIAYNRPSVKLIPLSKDGKVNTWNVRMGCNARRFDTFAEAIEFATAGWPIKRPVKEKHEVNDSERNLG
jgi:5-methylcytosine-specific restriction endonuclease McrA